MSRFLLPGVLLSAGFHAVFFLLGTPALPSLRCEKVSSSAVFLGSILSESDVMPPAQKTGVIFGRPDLGQDYGRSQALPPDKITLLKPHLMPAPVPAATLIAEPVLQAAVNLGAATLSFGCADADRYLVRMDFRDIQKMADRAELSAVMEMEVSVAPDGRVRSLRKITGSGDPILDSYVLLKFRQAVFRQNVVPADGRCRVIFRLR